MSTFSVDFSQPLSSEPRLRWLNEPASATPTPSGLRVVPHVGDWWSRTAQPGVQFEDKRVDEAAPLLLVSPSPFSSSSGDFQVTASLALFHRRDYDQAGVCVRVSSTCWLKANVERMSDADGGGLRLACCVTNGGYTDLAQQPLDELCSGGDHGGIGGAAFASTPPTSPELSSAPPPPSARRAAGGIPGASAAIRLRVRRRCGDYSVSWAPPPPPGEEEGGEATWTRFRLCRLHEDDGDVRVGVYASAPVAAGFVALLRSLEVAPGGDTPL